MVLRKLKNAVKRTLGLGSSVPSKTQKTMENNKDTVITSLKVVRSPIQSFIHKFLNVLTLGEWKKKLKEEGFDKLFHIKLVVNNKFALEKRPSVYFGNIRHEKDEEELNIPVNKKMTIGELISKAQMRMKNKFTEYDAFTNNCQDFIKGVLVSNGLYSPSINSFVYQDITKLIQKLPGYTKDIAKKITDTAGGVNEALSSTVGVELRRGGYLL